MAKPYHRFLNSIFSMNVPSYDSIEILREESLNEFMTLPRGLLLRMVGAYGESNKAMWRGE